MKDEDDPNREPGAPPSHPRSSGDVSRRDFLKIGGVAATVPLVGEKLVRAAGARIRVYGPGRVPVTLTVNGKAYRAELEPRVTLLDALRESLDLTGSKRVCDRGTCGACTVLLDNKPVYSCSVLAIEAQRHPITTVEGLGDPERLHPVQKAFWDNDAQQCGFCTPGFVVAAKALLDRNPHPTPAQIQKGLCGNLCRCGTYIGVRAAALQAAGASGPPRSNAAREGGRHNG
jgi:aerobic-type carbon monoxide dehydrogenase small subunit (CoxS/CutS family)